MTERKIRIATSVRVPVRTGTTIQIINAHDDAARTGAIDLSDADVIDLDEVVVDLEQFSDNMAAGMPLFMPVKPHRSGLHDNDNSPHRF